MLESASVVRTRIAQVESLSFGRVPELIESSHIKKVMLWVWNSEKPGVEIQIGELSA